MSKWIVVAVLLCAGVTACGGDGSGVSGNKSLVSLSSGEITDLCKYFTKAKGAQRMIDCGGGVTITVGGGSVDDCVTDLKTSQTDFPSCTATVDQAETCVEDLSNLTDQQLCSDTTPLPASCQPLFVSTCGGIM